MGLAVVRDLREPRVPAGPEELAAFEADVLAGFVLARAAAGLSDRTISLDVIGGSRHLRAVVDALTTGSFAHEHRDLRDRDETRDGAGPASLGSAGFSVGWLAVVCDARTRSVAHRAWLRPCLDDGVAAGVAVDSPGRYRPPRGVRVADQRRACLYRAGPARHPAITRLRLVPVADPCP